MPWERIQTINDYYDGPRLGVADVEVRLTFTSRLSMRHSAASTLTDAVEIPFDHWQLAKLPIDLAARASSFFDKWEARFRVSLYGLIFQG